RCFRTAARNTADRRRPLHAPGGPPILSRSRPKVVRIVCRSACMGSHSHFECCERGQVFERPDDQGVRGRHMEGGTMSGAVSAKVSLGGMKWCYRKWMVCCSAVR